MTANQINYAKLKEEQRTNLVNEEIKSRQATAAERQAGAAERNAGTNAAHLDIDRISASAAAEQARVAGINAATRQAELMATVRKNAEEINVKQQAQVETGRHNVETEKIQGGDLGVRAGKAAYDITTGLIKMFS